MKGLQSQKKLQPGSFWGVSVRPAVASDDPGYPAPVRQEKMAGDFPSPPKEKGESSFFPGQKVAPPGTSLFPKRDRPGPDFAENPTEPSQADYYFDISRVRA